MTTARELAERLPQRLRAMHDHLLHQPLTHADAQDLNTILAAADFIEAAQPVPGAVSDEVAEFVRDRVRDIQRNFTPRSTNRIEAEALLARMEAALSAPVAGASGEALRALIQSALDLLQEKKYGSPARSPGHNAQHELKAALAALSPSPDKPASGEEPDAIKSALAHTERALSHGYSLADDELEPVRVALDGAASQLAELRAEVEALTIELVAARNRPNPIDEALNSGDGTYRP